jgi:hypothetical protein
LKDEIETKNATLSKEVLEKAIEIKKKDATEKELIHYKALYAD